MTTRKAALRHEIRRLRAAEAPEVAAERARRIAAAAPALRSRAGVSVAGFQPTNHEPDISGLLRDLRLPVYLPRARSRTELEWVRARREDLRGGFRGIPRPGGPTVARGAAIGGLGVGVMLVPALAVDLATGARLGYGAGYYDRILGALADTVFTVGVCREQDLRAIPVEPHDVPVRGVLTEAGLTPIDPTGDAPTDPAPATA